MSLNPLFFDQESLGLTTDLYELTMAAAYFESGRQGETGTFELFTRRLPKGRSFLVAAGLEQAVYFLLNARFSASAIDYLRGLEVFEHVSSGFFEYLRDFRFSGDIWALPEGTLFFENEPVVQVEAPIIEAQLVETFLINMVNIQSMVASKAARICLASKGRSVVDFGSRRAHGPQTSVLAARASYIGGCDGTSNVLAGFELGVPVYGTMAHSFIQFFDDEKEAFREFSKVFPEHTTLLVDTYDSIEGVRQATTLDLEFQGIRLDSGDLASLSLESRKMLDEAGLSDVKIFVSGNLNEEKLLGFGLQDLPIDGFGVGTDLVVSSDAPTCDLVYKLVEVVRDGERIPRIKSSSGKIMHPFRKQIFRLSKEDCFHEDLVARAGENPPKKDAQPLLEPVIRKGALVNELASLAQIRERLEGQLKRLPASFKHLHTTEWYPVKFTASLKAALDELRSEHSG